MNWIEFKPSEQHIIQTVDGISIVGKENNYWLSTIDNPSIECVFLAYISIMYPTGLYSKQLILFNDNKWLPIYTHNKVYYACQHVIYSLTTVDRTMIERTIAEYYKI